MLRGDLFQGRAVFHSSSEARAAELVRNRARGLQISLFMDSRLLE